MPRFRKASLACVAAIIAAAACHSSNSTSPNTNMTSYSGHATGALTTAPVAGDTTTVAATTALPSGGGSVNTSVAGDTVLGLFNATQLQGSSVGQAGATSSSASASNVTIQVGTHTITAQFVGSSAQAVCTGSTPSVSGDATVIGLVVDGTPVSVDGSANQVVTLSGGGQITINEQTATANSITVNGLHVTMTGGFDVILAQSMASITCGTSCPAATGDFVSGGGWIPVSGGKATFGFEAGMVSSTSSGTLEFDDHSANVRVHSTQITGYTVVDNVTRTITGNATINGTSGTFTLTVVDNGEPGTGDTFDLSTSTGYHASGTLGGGNIQLNSQQAVCH